MVQFSRLVRHKHRDTLIRKKRRFDVMCGEAFSIKDFSLLTQSKQCDQMWSFPFIWCFASIFFYSISPSLALFLSLLFTAAHSLLLPFFTPVVSYSVLPWRLAHCNFSKANIFFVCRIAQNGRLLLNIHIIENPCTQIQSLSGFHFFARCAAFDQARSNEKKPENKANKNQQKTSTEFSSNKSY